MSIFPTTMQLLGRGVYDLLQIPAEYNQIRPHHLLVLYSSYQIIQYGLSKSTASLVVSTSSTTSTLVAWIQSIQTSCSQGVSNMLEYYGVYLVQAGYIPDFIIRWGIRYQLRNHLYQLETNTTSTSCNYMVERHMKNKMKIIQDLQTSPIAIETMKANEQHYEVPAEFYHLCLGPHKKYSCGYWLEEEEDLLDSPVTTTSTSTTTTMEESERNMLELYCIRSQIQDGMHVVDLGCGWGSLTLYLLQKYRNLHITAISNSTSQRQYILQTAKDRKLNVDHLTIITCNVADDQGALDHIQNQDLVLTIEMFEHMKNYQALLHKVQQFLKPKTGKLFVHIFTHKYYPYHFDSGWMSTNFFSGGTMPSNDLLLYFGSEYFHINHHWIVNGKHYERTSNMWLQLLDTAWKRGDLFPVLQNAYGIGKERMWYINWRLFFLACAELWGYDHGQEWIVSHYLFVKK